MSNDYYSILGVERGATQREIRKAYLKMAKKYHPDKNPEKDTTKQFQKISEAYHTLSNPQKRREYDTFGSSAGGMGGGGFSFHDMFSQGRGRHSGSFEEMFGGFFNFGGGRQRARKKPKGRDILKNLSLDLEQLFGNQEVVISFDTYDPCVKCSGKGHAGSTQTCYSCQGKGFNLSQSGITIMQTECSTCHGTGELGDCDGCRGSGRRFINKRIKIKVPKNISGEAIVKFPGKGEYNLGGYGDLLVKLVLREHKKCKKMGDDLIMEHVVKLEDIQNHVSQKLRSISNETIYFDFYEFQGKKIIFPLKKTIKNMGFFRVDGKNRGNLIIKLKLSMQCI
jgi:molecular chaperone DnaJ